MKTEIRSLFLAILSLSSPAFANMGYIANQSDSGITVFDTKTNNVVARIPTPGQFPIDVAVAPDGKTVYATNNAPISGIYVIDAKTNTITAGPIAIGTNLTGIAITPDGKLAYLCDNGGDKVFIFDLATNSLVVGAGLPITMTLTGPDDIAFTPDGLFAYVTNNGSNDVSIISTTSPYPVSPAVTVMANPEGIAMLPNGLFAYVANNGGSDDVTVINTSTFTTSSIALPGGSEPYGAVVSPDGRFVYTANNDGTVTQIDTSTNIPTTFPVGSSSANLYFPAVSPDGATVYTTSHKKPGDLFASSTVSYELIDSFFSGDLAEGIAIAPGPSVPTNVKAAQRSNDFGTLSEVFDLLTWDASPSSQTAGYVIYRNGVQIATVGTSPLQYEVHNQPSGVRTTYTITAVDDIGNESFPVSVTIN